MITGFFGPAFSPHPYVEIGIRVPLIGGNKWIPVIMLVDTGAIQSCLHPSDVAGGFRVPESRLADDKLWPTAAKPRGVGGGATYFPCAAQYGFVHPDGREQLIEGTVWIGQLTEANRNLPSLLGWDVLQHFRLEIDGPDKTVSLYQRDESTRP